MTDTLVVYVLYSTVLSIYQTIYQLSIYLS